MTETPSIGVAVLGLDHWYTAFAALEILSESTVAPLRGIADPAPDRLKMMRGKYPNATITADAGELLDRDDVGLVAVCTSTDQAPALAQRALRAGKHVVCVKPAARTLDELDETIAVATAAGRFFGSFEGMQRLHPRATVARDLIRGGAIGTPLSFFQRGHGGLPAPWPGRSGDPAVGGDSWWLHPERVPGGAWIDHAIYALDFARFVLGDTDDTGNIDVLGSAIERRVAPELPLEDYGIALMRLTAESGASVSLILEDTWAAAPGGGTSRQEFLGAAGGLRLENGAWIVTRDGSETRHQIPAAPFFPFDELIGQLARGETPPFGPSDARAALKACLAVYG